MPTDSPWMTTSQCAAKIGTSTEFVRGEIRDHRLEAHVIARDGKRMIYRISVESFERYLYRFWGTSSRLMK